MFPCCAESSIGFLEGFKIHMSITNQNDTYSEAETVARREAALKRAFAMPHRPHKASKVKRVESHGK